ncbi:MAG: CoA-binding protein, partial [Candidatus Thorarchaeota archaeon]|nr:CoA-binding protein [Candidatus Thorarchaeota archaeon]
QVDWKIESLDRLFNPTSIAVVGASDKPERLGALTLKAVEDYQGDVYPVNPRITKIGNMQCYPSITDIPNQVDLALICVRGGLVPKALEDAADAGVRAAVIFAAGYKELGPNGEKEQRKIRNIVEDAQIAVIGPNCLGAGNINRNLNATFFPHPLPMRKGGVAILSQSGGVCGMMLYRAVDADVGISKFASVGNRVNIDFHDLLRYLRQDKETKALCLFIEGTEQAREMYEEMKLTTPEKPVLVFKVGKTPAARNAALSHTGSLAGEPLLYSAAIKQSGGLEVDSIMDMMDTAKVLSITSKRPQNNRVAIITHTLGIALVAAQTLEEEGVILPTPPEEIQSKIENLLQMPMRIPINNPIDLLAKGWAEPAVFADAFRYTIECEIFGSIITVFAPNFQEGIGGGMPIDEIIEASARSEKIVISILSSPITRMPLGQKKLENAGIPVFVSPQRAGRALANIIRLSRL